VCDAGNDDAGEAGHDAESNRGRSGVN
jgi:hypothetical protein